MSVIMTTEVIAKKTLLLSDNLPFLAFDIKFFKFKKEFSIKFLILNLNYFPKVSGFL